MEQHDRSRTNARERSLVDHVRARLLDVTRIDIPQHSHQAVGGERLFQPTVRQAKRGTKQPWPGVASAYVGIVAVIAMTPTMHADLMAGRGRATQQALTTREPLAEHVERRVRGVTVKDVKQRSRNRTGPSSNVSAMPATPRSPRAITEDTTVQACQPVLLLCPHRRRPPHGLLPFAQDGMNWGLLRSARETRVDW
jgi:hypothetical protein